MRINEIFYSLQGEGRSIGKPTLFIRLSGCTLQCNFCDTQYHTKSRDLNKKDIKLLIKYKHWTITGGEPMLQQKGIIDLIKLYKPTFIEIETNGTVYPELDFAHRISCFNISPKEPRFQPKALQKKCDPILLSAGSLIGDRILKFVYSDKQSEKFINTIVTKYNVFSWEIWIMPKGKTRKEQEVKQVEAWNYCMKKGYNFSGRLHISVFNLKRGV